MKRDTLKTALCVSAIALSLCLAPAVSYAEAEQTSDAAGQEVQQDAEGVQAEGKEIHDVVFTLNGDDIVIGNRTGKNMDKTAVILKQLPVDGQEGPVSLIFVDDTGAEHVFENAEPKKWSVPILVEDLGFLYIQFLDEAQANQEIVETGAEKDLDQKVTVHVTADVNVRSEPNVESSALLGAAAGTSFTAVGSAPGWVKVEMSNGTGYISHRFISHEDSSSADPAAAQNTGTTADTSGTAQRASSGYSQNNDSGNTYQGTTGSRTTTTGNNTGGNNTTGNNTTGDNTADNTTSGNDTTGGNNTPDTGSGTTNVTDSVADVDIPDVDYGSSDSTETGGGSSEGGSEDSSSYSEPEADAEASEE